MPRLSIMKISGFFLIIFLLAHSGKILRAIAPLYIWGYDSLSPLRDSPEDMRFVITLGILALVVIVIWKLFNRH